MNLVEDFVSIGEPFSGPRHFQHEEILRLVQQAPDDINWTNDHPCFKERLSSWT